MATIGEVQGQLDTHEAVCAERYLGINAGLNAFFSPKPFNSWVLNNDTAQWDAPTPMPTDGKKYSWDEDTTSWVENV